jgi:hypothetical protein
MANFLRHKKGGGRVYDEAEVSADSFLSRHSEARGISDIQSSVINDSVITDSFVHQGKITNSSVTGAIVAGRVHIENSIVVCDKVAGNARIENSEIYGESRILQNARIENCAIRNLTVSGGAHLKNWSLATSHVFDCLYGRIMAGVWERPPRIVRFDDLGTTVTEGVGDFAYVGCIGKPVTRWLKIGDKYGSAMGWTPEQVKSLRSLFERWLDEKL